MKKIYYYIMAISMTIISIIFAPIKSFAAGNSVNGNLSFNSWFKSTAQCTSTPELVNQELNDNDDPVLANYRFTVNMRNQRVSDTSQNNSMYINGYMFWSLSIEFSFSNVSSNSWKFSYDINYVNDLFGVSAIVPQVTAGTNVINVYFYTFFDNTPVTNNNQTLNGANITFDFSVTILPNAATDPYTTMSIDSLTFTSRGFNAELYANPIWPVGESRIYELAVEKAVDLAIGQDINDLVTYLYSIYTLFPQYMDNILSELTADRQLLSSISNYLSQIYVQDRVFYNNLMLWLQTYGEQKASEAQSEATQVEEQMSQIGESLEIEQPSIGGAFDAIDEELDSDAQNDLFFYLHGNKNMLVTILIICFSLALMGYVLYGRI